MERKRANTLLIKDGHLYLNGNEIRKVLNYSLVHEAGNLPPVLRLECCIDRNEISIDLSLDELRNNA